MEERFRELSLRQAVDEYLLPFNSSTLAKWIKKGLVHAEVVGEYRGRGNRYKFDTEQLFELTGREARENFNERRRKAPRKDNSEDALITRAKAKTGPDDWAQLTWKEAAAVAGVSTKTMYRWMRFDVLEADEARYLNGKWYFYMPNWEDIKVKMTDVGMFNPTQHRRFHYLSAKYIEMCEELGIEPDTVTRVPKANVNDLREELDEELREESYNELDETALQMLVQFGNISQEKMDEILKNRT